MNPWTSIKHAGGAGVFWQFEDVATAESSAMA
jgi:hypothetical protein